MRVCEVGQLYKAFRRWCDASGERFPPKQTEFTLQASRFAGERIERDDDGRRKEPPFTLRVFQVPHELTTSGRKAYRCWVPRGCAATDAYETEGKWAGSCIDDFEKVLRGFMRPARFDDGDDSPAGDGA
jgi:hypothetical protein